MHTRISQSTALLVTVCLAAMLCASAAPASAWWETAGHQPKGPVKVISFGTINFEGPALVCPAEELNAEWRIQTKGQIKAIGREGNQERTSSGPHLYVQIKKWGKCRAAIGLSEFFGSEIKISPCELQFVQQQKGSLTATVGFSTTCVIEIATACVIQVPPGMETLPGSDEGINVGQNEVALANVEKPSSSQLDKANITGIHASALGIGCPKTTLIGKWTGLEFNAEGVKEI